MRKFKSVQTHIAVFVAMCLLFAQMATAAYACPQMNQKSTSTVAAEAVAMSDCEAMRLGQIDEGQPLLCKAHCEAGQQAYEPKTGDDVSAPALAIFWSIAWVVIPLSEFVVLDACRLKRTNSTLGSAPIYLINQVFRL